MSGKIITLEGNVGVGKTTLAKSLAKLYKSKGYNVNIFLEYVNNNLLGMYLRDMKRYAFPFQSIIVTIRKNVYREATQFAKNGGIAIIDRSLFGDYAFAVMQKNKGFFSEEEWEVYLSIFSECKYPDDGSIIFLDCKTETIMERIKKRGNQDEISSYNIQYIEDLRDSYEEAFKFFGKSTQIQRIKYDKRINIGPNGLLPSLICEQFMS